jgi:tetratricopeptide (TPR) repeat protein
MVWPFSLSVLYPYPDTLAGWKVAGACILLVLITWVGIKNLKQKPWFAIGWLWYLGTLVPVIGLVQVGTQAMADRYTYIPLIGLFIIIAWGVPELMPNWYHKTKGLIIITAVAILILMVTTMIQVSYWKNSISLYQHAIKITSNNYMMHNNLGIALTARGKFNEAIKHYNRALRINSDYETANLNLGIALVAQGKMDKGIEYYREVLREKPHYARVHNNLGSFLLIKGDLENATEHFKKALRINKNYAEAYNGLGSAMKIKGEIEEAIALFQKALQIKPDFINAQKNLKKTISERKNE